MKKIKTYKRGVLFFRLGIFFLVSAPSVSVIFFLISLLLSAFYNYKSFFADKWNYPFILASILLTITVSLSSLTLFSNNLEGWENYLNWISLFNWIPLFFCIWAFKPYLNNANSRKQILLILLSGSVPLILSGFLQVFFNIHGPLRILNGLIIWFQRGDEPGLTGLFNNRNYASSWFSLLWPICLALITQNQKERGYKKLITYIFSIIILVSLYLTFSRNGYLNLFLSSVIFLKSSLSIWIIILMIIFSVLIFAAKTNIFPLGIQELANKILPNKILSRFSSIKNLDNIYNSPRFLIWSNAIDFIKERPILGWGAASFPILYKNKNDICCTVNFGQWYGHAHNLQIEMALNYGLFFSLLVNFTLIYIFIKSFKKIFINKTKNIDIDTINLFKFEKAWWTCSFSLFFSQLFDIQYYDLRISLIFWIFISGLISKLQEFNKEIKNFKKSKI